MATAKKDRSLLVVSYTAIMVLLKMTVFTGTGLFDTFAFILLFLSLFFATDHSIVQPWARRLVVGGVLFVVMPVIGIGNTFYLDVVTQVAIYAVLALGLNIVVGFAGLLDLGFVAFFAVGAYFWAIVGSTQGNEIFGGGFPLPADMFFLATIVSIGLAALAGVLLGLPVLRLRGDYLAMVTLGFGEVIRVLANNLDKPVNITNGPQGITSIGQPLTEVAAALASPAVAEFKWQALIYYGLVLLALGGALVVNKRLDASKIGRAWIAIREDEIAAQAMGIPLVHTKLIAFATGASFAGAMGALYAAKQTFVSPESFDFNQSIGILAMIVFGGLGSIRGAITGAALVTILNLQVLKALSTGLNNLRSSGYEILGFNFADIPSQFEPSKYERLIFGVILVAMMLYRPRGLVPAERGTLVADEAELGTGKENAR
ncbi:branched-chain amino acid ABC transporter permease [Chthonobacter albigriseus]|uniref:branched-chain amino acid ABC transporter permease n=1 Tax=Chthonobacter albigriseus TaxID=1683161 RepID=UPI0015EF1F93|nr:branched-chain amino acid ABC transporter permease [Chthonobacter albigriseus]